MLKKTAVTGGLLIVAAAGALVTTCSPVFATPTQLPSDHSSSWNGNESEGFNHIRLHLRNRNNNIAVARTPRRERRRDFIGAPVTAPPITVG